MTNNDPLAACLSKLDNAEKVSKNEVTIIGKSKFMDAVIKILKDHDYLGEVESVENRKGGEMNVKLIGHINRCGAIKPRFKVKISEIEKFEQRYLPGKGFGILIISTSKGLITNTEAKEKNVGGRLIAYCY